MLLADAEMWPAVPDQDDDYRGLAFDRFLRLGFDGCDGLAYLGRSLGSAGEAAIVSSIRCRIIT